MPRAAANFFLPLKGCVRRVLYMLALHVSTATASGPAAPTKGFERSKRCPPFKCRPPLPLGLPHQQRTCFGAVFFARDQPCASEGKVVVVVVVVVAAAVTNPARGGEGGGGGTPCAASFTCSSFMCHLRARVWGEGLASGSPRAAAYLFLPPEQR